VTDVAGKSHTLYIYLNAGKYVLLSFMFDGWPSCPGLVGDYNTWWTSYGCNDFNLVVLEIDKGDNNQAVIAWGKKYGVKYPAVSGSDGGGNTVCSNFGVGSFPSVRIIAPDKSIALSANFPDGVNAKLQSLGIEKHVCNITEIIPDLPDALKPYNAIKQLAIQKVNTSSILARIPLPGEYSITICSANGRVINSFKCNFSEKGNKTISWSTANMSKGLFIIEVKCATQKDRVKFLLTEWKIVISICPKTNQLLSFRHSFSRNPPFINNLRDWFPLKAYGDDVSGQTLISKCMQNKYVVYNKESLKIVIEVYEVMDKLTMLLWR
jgi:hypothetical protein